MPRPQSEAALLDDEPRYRVLGPLGQGGMGAVYLARALGVGGFQRLVVMKRLRAELAGDPAVVRMFLDEARLCAALSHPHIVQVMDVGRDDGGVYLVMEHLHGFDLMTVLRRAARLGRSLPLPLTLYLVQAACLGLHHAHEARGADGQPLELVHRDVSPHNVIATFEGEVKVIDFGIAKARDRLGGTRTGAIKGKLGYMSPEQCRGRQVDRRSDVFGLGILLLELTTGRRVFVGRDDYEVLRAIVEEPAPRPTALVAGYPAELEPIALRALAAEPQQRYGTALELCEALDAVAQRHGRAGARELAALMRELFAEELARARSAPGEALLATLAPPRDPDPPALREGASEGLAVDATGAATATASPAMALPSHRRWRRWLPATLAAATLAAGARWWSQGLPPATTAPTGSRPPTPASPVSSVPDEPSGPAASNEPPRAAKEQPMPSGPGASSEPPRGSAEPAATPNANANVAPAATETTPRQRRRLRPDSGQARRAAAEVAPPPVAPPAAAPLPAAPTTAPPPASRPPAAQPRTPECADDDCVL